MVASPTRICFAWLSQFPNWKHSVLLHSLHTYLYLYQISGIWDHKMGTVRGRQSDTQDVVWTRAQFGGSDCSPWYL